jgi:uncharacterized protein (DUF885 family)
VVGITAYKSDAYSSVGNPPNHGAICHGTSAQPFKTEKDYTNFLKRMDTYSIWLDLAMVYMKKGIEKGVVLPKALTEDDSAICRYAHRYYRR